MDTSSIHGGNCPLRQVRGRKYKPVLMTLPPPMIRALDAVAIEKGLDSRSELVRDVLSAFLKEQKIAA